MPHPYGSRLSQEQLVAVGMIAVEGAALEHTLGWAISAMVGLPYDIGELFTIRQSFEEKVNTFIRVVHKRSEDPALRKKAAEVEAQMRASSQHRNEVIHAHWDWTLEDYFLEEEERSGSGRAWVRKLRKAAAESRAIAADVPALRKTAEELWAASMALIEFVEDAGLDQSDAKMAEE
jgi:hypothetical protein